MDRMIDWLIEGRTGGGWMNGWVNEQTIISWATLWRNHEKYEVIIKYELYTSFVQIIIWSEEILVMTILFLETMNLFLESMNLFLEMMNLFLEMMNLFLEMMNLFLETMNLIDG